MKLKKQITVTHEIDTLEIIVPVRYEEEDIPNDFPMRRGDMWSAFIDLDTHKIRDWPKGKSGRMQMKVCDGGTYYLYEKGKQIAAIEQDYVPNGLVPGEYGDYIDLDIGEDGTILNWKKNASFRDFEGEQD